MSKSLEELKVLTEKVKLIDFAVNSGNSNVMPYDFGNGMCVGVGLLKSDLVAVQQIFLAKGTTFPEHSHKSHELGIVYKGEVEVFCNSEKVTYGPGDFMYFPPGILHTGVALSDSEMIFITVPPDEAYPDGR